MPQRILPAELTATPERELWIENVKLRAEYLNETQLLTEAEVDSTFASDNERVPVSQWKREAKVFSVRQSGIDLYPAFQFSDGAPLPVIDGYSRFFRKK